jgi:HSP20 family molecular chaperone IbpA
MSQDPLEDMQREVERLFHDLVYHGQTLSHFGEPLWSPPADLVVSKRGARVLIELAGVPRESVKVTLHGRTLEVSGRRVPPPRSASLTTTVPRSSSASSGARSSCRGTRTSSPSSRAIVTACSRSR